ncbi:amidase domain-containing protein [Brevibacillus sp. SAFN-007a]|uniref:amidase domain-containing protein n=1 Tax=Brevibacillus sp. SAFN-007a TaxID=3436862 RepID=UPI003F813ED8
MEWRAFVQRYFDAVHQTILDGQYRRLLPFYREQKPLWQQEWVRIARAYQQMRKRGAALHGASGRVQPVCWLETEAAIDITVVWTGESRYLLKGRPYEEASSRMLQLRLDKAVGQWAIVGTREQRGDQKSGGEEERERQSNTSATTVEDAASQPLLVVHGAGGYQPEKAVAYAERYWNATNPAYPRFTDDCTNFISQCLHAGGIPMLMSKERGKGWWIRTGKSADWSYSWTVAHSLYLLLKSGGPPMRAVAKKSAAELVPGDIICYDFNGDGRVQHTTIVVAMDANQMPLVNAHTTDSSMRYWAYEDSTAYTPRIRYAFYHIRGM